MAVSAGTTALPLGGDLVFFAGGMDVSALIGTFVKSISSTGLVTFQAMDGTEDTLQLAAGSGGEVYIPTAVDYSQSLERITLTTPMNAVDGDIIAFVAPDNIDDADRDLVLRTFDGTDNGASLNLIDLGGVDITAADLTAGQSLLVVCKGTDYRMLTSINTDHWRDAWSATSRYSDGDIFTHHDAQFLVYGGQDSVLIPEPIQYQERRADIQIIGTHWSALKTSIDSDTVSTITSYFSIGQTWIFSDERAFLCVETGMYLHSDIPDSDGWKEVGAGTIASVFVNEIFMDGIGTADVPLTTRAIAGSGGPPQASATYEGRIYVDVETLNLLVCTNTPHETSEATGTFTAPSTGVVLLPQRLPNDRPAAVLDTYYYAIHDDQFLVGTQLGPGIVGYVQDTAFNALENARTNTSWDVHWLGPLDDDEAAAAAIQTLDDDTDYFYYGRLGIQIRRLTPTSFTPAGGTINHYNWAPPNADDYRDRVDRVEGGSLPAIPADGTGDSWIRVSDDGIYIIDVEHHPATAPTAGSWATFADGTDFEGVAANDGDIPIAGSQYYFNSRHFTFRDTYIDTSLAIRYRDRAVPSGYIGHFDSRQDALNHAAARGIDTGDSFSAFTGTLVETATMLTASASFETTRNWQFIPVDAEGGSGSSDSAAVALYTETANPATYSVGANTPWFRPFTLTREPAADRLLQVEIIENTPNGGTAAFTVHTSDHIETNNIVGATPTISALTAVQRANVDTSASPSRGHTVISKITRGGENTVDDFGHSDISIGYADNADGDYTLYIAHSHWSLLAAHTVRILERSLGSGTASSDTAETGSGRTLRRAEWSASSFSLAENAFDVDFSTSASIVFNSIADTPVAKSDLYAISLLFRIDDRFTVPMYLDKTAINYVGYDNSGGWPWGSSDLVPAAYWSSAEGSGTSKEPTRLRPSRFQYTSRANAGLPMIFVFLRENTSDELSGVSIRSWSDRPITLEALDVIYWEDA